MVDNNLSATQQKEDMNELKNLYDSKQFNILEKKTKELITKYSNHSSLGKFFCYGLSNFSASSSCFLKISTCVSHSVSELM